MDSKNLNLFKNLNQMFKDLNILFKNKQIISINFKKEEKKEIFKKSIKNKIFFIKAEEQIIKIKNRTFYNIIKYLKTFFKISKKNLYRVLKNLNMLKTINLKNYKKNKKMVFFEKLIKCEKIRMFGKFFTRDKEIYYKLIKILMSLKKKHILIIFDTLLNNNFSKNLKSLEKLIDYNKKKIKNFMIKNYKILIIFKYGIIINLKNYFKKFKYNKIFKKKKICNLNKKINNFLLKKINKGKIFIKN